ncbi:MAG: aminopeptidase [archaeon]
MRREQIARKDSLRRRELATNLRAKQDAFARAHPSQFAAYTIAKQLSTSRSPGNPVKTATVFYDKHNAVTGRALEKEFTRRGIKTQSLGFVRDEPNLRINRHSSAAINKLSKNEAVVFLTKGNKSQFDNNADLVVNSVERRSDHPIGSRLALIYGIDNMKATRVLGAKTRDNVLMRRFTRKTIAAVRGARTLKCTTRSGTNLTFTLSPKVKWLPDDGIITKKLWGNFVSGEAYTTPLRVDGTIVLDMFVTGVGDVSKTPIRARISKGRVVFDSIQCASETARQKFLKILQTDKNASRIGELGLGTNVAVKQLTGGILIDEKFPGLHVAFGDGYGEYTGIKGRDSLEHNDALLRNPTIVVDGKRTIMRDGKSLLK